MTEPKKPTAVGYRKQAEEARHAAAIAMSTLSREGHLRLAADWDKHDNVLVVAWAGIEGVSGGEWSFSALLLSFTLFFMLDCS